MFKDVSEWNKVKIAYKTSKIEELKALSKDENTGVKIAIANNSNTSSEILKNMVNDESWWVRIAIAKHPNSDKETLTLLGDKEEIWPVKKALLENKNTPIDLLIRISNEDSKKWIAERKLDFRF